MFSSRVSVELQYGQRCTAFCSWSSVGAAAARAVGGAKPASRSFSRPAGVILSVDHESSSRTSTCGSPPSPVTASSICRAHRVERGTAHERRREGDPHAVAVDGDVLDDPEVDERDDRDLRIRDLRQRVPDPLRGHHCAPTGADRRTIVISFQSSANSAPGAERSTASTSGRPDALREHRSQLRREHAQGVRPELVGSVAVALLVAQPVEPHLGVQAVIDLFTLDLRRDPRELVVLVLLQPLDPDRVRCLVEHVPGDRARPVGHETQLDERRAAVLLGRAIERERVGVRVEVARGEVVEGPRMADLVLRDRGEGDVLLEERRDARPLRVAPAEDQLVVGELKKQLYPRFHEPPSAAP